MLHGRRDYDPIQDPRGRIAEDEPVFLIRAKDALAPAILGLYADLLRQHINDRAMVANVEEHAQRMRDWQAANEKQHPDVLPGFYRSYTPPPPAPVETAVAPRVAATDSEQVEQFSAPPGWKRDPRTGQWSRTDLPSMPPDLTNSPPSALETHHDVRPSDELEIAVRPAVKRTPEEKNAAFRAAYGGDPHKPASPVENVLNEETPGIQIPPVNEGPVRVNTTKNTAPLAEGAEKLMGGQPKEHKPVAPSLPPEWPIAPAIPIDPPAVPKPLNEGT